MALVAGSWAGNFTFKDIDGDSSTITVYLTGAATFAEADTFAIQTAAALQSISDGVLTGYSIGLDYVENAPANAPETSEVERKGRFAFQLANGKQTSVSIPSIRTALVINGSNVINTLDPAVTAFTALMVGATNDVGLFITSLLKAEKRIRSRDK